jgi:hypothetical protein
MVAGCMLGTGEPASPPWLVAAGQKDRPVKNRPVQSKSINILDLFTGASFKGVFS